MYSGIKKQEIQLFLVPHSTVYGNYKITVQESLRTVKKVCYETGCVIYFSYIILYCRRRKLWHRKFRKKMMKIMI